MLPPTSLAQASLAATIVASTIGTYMALSPPNPSPQACRDSSGDVIRSIGLTGKHSTKISIIPLAFLALHTASLAYSYPNLPPSLARHGIENGLNSNLLTWSPSTALPLAAILMVGVPLRLASYASLGRDFTFALATPGRLNTGGLYRHVQHPSYTGLVALALGNVALVARLDGALGCWVAPRWYGLVGVLEPVGAVLAWCLFVLVVMTRVRQEERMLRARFGDKWERWHARTARFVPWLV